MIEVGLTRTEVQQGIESGRLNASEGDLILCSEVKVIDNKKEYEDITGNIIMVYFDQNPTQRIELLGFELSVVWSLDFSKLVGFAKYIGS